MQMSRLATPRGLHWLQGVRDSIVHDMLLLQYGRVDSPRRCCLDTVTPGRCGDCEGCLQVLHHAGYFDESFGEVGPPGWYNDGGRQIWMGAEGWWLRGVARSGWHRLACQAYLADIVSRWRQRRGRRGRRRGGH